MSVMRSKLPEGGPAFPVKCPDNSVETGMSLRDWFAGKALEGLLAGNHELSIVSNPVPLYTEEAYVYADAMLAERAKE